MEQWIITLVSGALGAALGFGGTWVLGEIQRRERRSIYLHLLAQQLHSIGEPQRMDDSRKWMSIPTDYVTASSTILASDVLKVAEDRQLVTLLVEWEAWVSGYRELCQQVNIATFSQSLGDQDRRLWNSRIGRARAYMFQLAQSILEELAGKGIQPNSGVPQAQIDTIDSDRP